DSNSEFSCATVSPEDDGENSIDGAICGTNLTVIASQTLPYWSQ
ncbi:3220_t:CDS:2, partial [Entrophospora sp. SA101]